MGLFKTNAARVEAWQWDETKEGRAVLEENGIHCGNFNSHEKLNYVRNLRLHTKQGFTRVELGDWIVKDENDQIEIVTDDDFIQEYQEALEAPTWYYQPTVPGLWAFLEPQFGVQYVTAEDIKNGVLFGLERGVFGPLEMPDAVCEMLASITLRKPAVAQ